MATLVLPHSMSAINATTFHLQAAIFNLVFPRPPNEARVLQSK
jgi:hypothetical protein